MNKFNTVEEELQRMRELSGIKEILDESGFARINKMLWGGVPSVNSVGILTAENPGYKHLTPEENNKRTEKLKRYLGSNAYGYIKIKGKDVNNNHIDNSFLIPNMSKNNLIRLGNDFGQQEVIYGERKEDDKFIFEWIENGKTDEKNKQEVIITKLTGEEPYYSYLSKTIKKDGEKIKYERIFRIPFFDELKKKRNGLGTWEITESYGFLDIDIEKLSKDNKETNLLLKEIEKNNKELLIKVEVPRYYYISRRYRINESINLIKEILYQKENGFIDVENLPKGNEEVLNLLKEIRENKKGLIINNSLSNDYFVKKTNINESFKELNKLIKENIIHKLTEEQLEEITKDQEVYNYFLTYDKPFIYSNSEQHYNESKQKSLELFNHEPKNFKKFCFEEYQRNIK